MRPVDCSRESQNKNKIFVICAQQMNCLTETAWERWEDVFFLWYPCLWHGLFIQINNKHDMFVSYQVNIERRIVCAVGTRQFCGVVGHNHLWSSEEKKDRFWARTRRTGGSAVPWVRTRHCSFVLGPLGHQTVWTRTRRCWCILCSDFSWSWSGGISLVAEETVTRDWNFTCLAPFCIGCLLLCRVTVGTSCCCQVTTAQNHVGQMRCTVKYTLWCSAKVQSGQVNESCITMVTYLMVNLLPLYHLDVEIWWSVQVLPYGRSYSVW